jgi:hypothetical protein
VGYTYYDMTPERRKCAVREAPQRRPLLDNDSLCMFQQQRIGLWEPKRCYEINTRFRSNGWARGNIGIVGGGDLYSVRSEVGKRGGTRDSFVEEVTDS